MEQDEFHTFQIEETPQRYRRYSFWFFKYIRPCVAEFLATMLFVFLDVCSDAGMNTFFYFVLLAVTASVSGGYLNPAVSLALTICRHLEKMMLLLYVLSQVLGGIVGAGFAKVALNQSKYNEYDGGVSKLKLHIDPGQGILAEMLATSILVLAVLMVALDERNRTILGPLVVGYALGGGRWAIVDIAKASMNPARTFGTAVVRGCWKNYYVFWLGPALGSIFSTGVYGFVLASPNKLWIPVHDPVG